MKSIILKIKGMHCGSCALDIDGTLEDDLKGIKSSTTSYAKQETKVEFDEKEVSLAQIIKTVQATGYEAMVSS